MTALPPLCPPSARPVLLPSAAAADSHDLGDAARRELVGLRELNSMANVGFVLCGVRPWA